MIATIRGNQRPIAVTTSFWTNFTGNHLYLLRIYYSSPASEDDIDMFEYNNLDKLIKEYKTIAEKIEKSNRFLRYA